MELKLYDVIVGPVMSEKAYKTNKNADQLVLEVHPRANKAQIKDALEKLFNVKINSVRTMIRKKPQGTSTARKFNAQPTLKRKKIAYVGLKEGYTLNLFEQSAKESQ